MRDRISGDARGFGWIKGWLCCLGLILVLAGCAHPQPQTLDATLPWREFQLGLCEDYPANSRTLEAARADLVLLATNRVKFLRTAIAWDALEPRQGEFDWRYLDGLVGNAEELGVTLIPYVCYTPEWSARDTNAFWTQPPKRFEDYGRVMQELATRYKGRIRSWEIWNEPDNREYWTGSVKEYANLLKIGSKAVRQADPGAKVVSGGLAWNLDFLRELLETPGVSSAIDVVNLHNYYETWSDDAVEDIGRYANRASRIMQRAGAREPIWLAELGYSTFRTNSHVSDAYQATYKYEHTPEYQSVSLFRMLVPVMASTHVQLAAWYRIHDLPAAQEVIGDVNNHHLGVLFTNSQPKPALRSLAFMQRVFGNGFIPMDSGVLLTRSISSDVEVHSFLTRDGSFVIVVWLKVIQPNRPPPIHAGPTDSRREPIWVSIPAGFESKGVVFNQEGRIVGRALKANRQRTAQLLIPPGEVRLVVFSANGAMQGGSPTKSFDGRAGE